LITPGRGQRADKPGHFYQLRRRQGFQVLKDGFDKRPAREPTRACMRLGPGLPLLAR
jgi:hypothetical protein